VAVVDTGKVCSTDEFSPTTSVKVLRSILFRKTSAHILCARRFSFTSLAEE
jgi:hypothetical protein